MLKNACPGTSTSALKASKANRSSCCWTTRASALLPGAPDVSADPNGPQISAASTDNKPEGNTANKAFVKASPSVVCITSYKGGADPVLNKLGTGSGIIISSDGYIATNSHVVDDSTKTGVMVTTYDGYQYLGTIIGVDAKTDLAVLKIDANGLVPAEFADSDSLYVGQVVFAIGCPGGSNFSNSLTSGTVSFTAFISSSIIFPLFFYHKN